MSKKIQEMNLLYLLLNIDHTLHHPHIKEFVELSLSLQYGFIFFDDNFKHITKDEFIELTNKTSSFSLSICQCSPD